MLAELFNFRTVYVYGLGGYFQTLLRAAPLLCVMAGVSPTKESPHVPGTGLRDCPPS